MIYTNKEKLLSQSVTGKISHPIMLVNGGLSGGYVTTWDGKPKIGLGIGGIKYNVKVGDPCFGWPETEYLEPGASLEASSEKVGGSSMRPDRTAMAFYKLSCIGNEVKVISGDGKNAIGVVTGKTGYASSPSHLLAHFRQSDLEKMNIEDKVRVKSVGIGLKIEGFKGSIFNMSPRFLESLGLELNEGEITFPVVKEIPPYAMVSGVGGDAAESGHWCIQSNPPELVEEMGLEDLRIGDIVACRDVLMSYGKGYHRGAITIGVVAFGASDQAGHGPGVFAIAASKKGNIKPRIDDKANLKNILKLEM